MTKFIPKNKQLLNVEVNVTIIDPFTRDKITVTKFCNASEIKLASCVAILDNHLEMAFNMIIDCSNPDADISGMSDITVNQIENETRCLKFKIPITFKPKLSESKKYIEVIDNDVGINILAKNMEDLCKQLKDDLIMIWEEYALAPDNVLEDNAKTFKYRLLDIIEEIEVNK